MAKSKPGRLPQVRPPGTSATGSRYPSASGGAESEIKVSAADPLEEVTRYIVCYKGEYQKPWDVCLSIYWPNLERLCSPPIKQPNLCIARAATLVSRLFVCLDVLSSAPDATRASNVWRARSAMAFAISPCCGKRVEREGSEAATPAPLRPPKRWCDRWRSGELARSMGWRR